MGVIYKGEGMDCVVMQGRKFTKKDVGKLVNPPFKNEDEVVEQFPAAFAYADESKKVSEVDGEGSEKAGPGRPKKQP